MKIFAIIFSFIFGGIIGSFLNVVILRLPKEQSLTGRSHCAVCRHGLSAGDLLPMLSFLLLWGKCRYCKAKISPRYFIIEFITACLFTLCWLYLQPYNFFSWLVLVKFWLAAAVLLVVFVIDLEHYLILDSVVFPTAVIMAGLNLLLDLSSHQPIFSLGGMFISGILGAAVITLPFFLLWYFSKGAWMGFGDVKLVILLGLILGFPAVLAGLMVSVMLGAIVSVLLLLFTAETLKSRVPFGTFLAFGTMLCLFYGQNLINWYLTFLGL